MSFLVELGCLSSRARMELYADNTSFHLDAYAARCRLFLCPSSQLATQGSKCSGRYSTPNNSPVYCDRGRCKGNTSNPVRHRLRALTLSSSLVSNVLRVPSESSIAADRQAVFHLVISSRKVCLVVDITPITRCRSGDHSGEVHVEALQRCGPPRASIY